MYAIDANLGLLFSSSARVKILTLFITNPKRRFYQREVAKFTHLPIRAVQRELVRMERLGLLETAREGNRVYYQVNEKFFLYPELKGIVLKTSGLGSILRDNLQAEEDILVAFIHGSYAQNRETISSDIDLFLVGEISSKDLHKLIRKAQGISGREINYALYTPEEFKKRVQTKDHFISEVLHSAKIFIKGSESDLQKIAR